MQQRSAQRVERMLESCAELIEEHGYDGVTTTSIAERAGVAVGSLYQFFPDKRAVVQALTARNLDLYLTEIKRRVGDSQFTDWREAVDAALDAYTDMFRSTPGFSQIRFGDVVDVRLLDDQRDNNTVISDEFAALLVENFGLSLDEIRLPIAVAVEISDGILDLAFRRKSFDVDTVIAEARHTVHVYLESRLPRDR
jgi:AcrR family transcriptional regulator